MRSGLLRRRGSALLLIGGLLTCGAFAACGGRGVSAADAPSGALVVHPAKLKLIHPRWPQSLVATVVDAEGFSHDLTAQATFAVDAPDVVRVDAFGAVHGLKDGKAKIAVQAGGKQATVEVEVDLPEAAPPASFVHDVMPVLSKAGCNQGACHGYSLGKNGFKLSLRGSDPQDDLPAIRDEIYGRRINPQRPEASLLLTKARGDVPHGGGVRFDRGSPEEQLVLRWIGEGAAADSPAPSPVVEVTVFPQRIVLAPGAAHQLQLSARYADGTVRDVTSLGIFTSNSERYATVDAGGLVRAVEHGETAVVCRFERLFAVTGAIVLPPGGDFVPTPVPQDDLIDRHVTAKLNSLKVKPAGIADDATFLRRVHLDLIGTAPTAPELQAFLGDADPQKRTKLVDALFARPEFVDRWSLKWGDLLQNTRTRLSDPATFAFREWIRGAVASNMPLDEFARRVLTARGSTADDPATAWLAAGGDVNENLERAAQVFVGVRMLCARCHAHPLENWTQRDYYGLASFFNQVGTKKDPRFATDPKAKIVTIDAKAAFARNPRSGQLQPPRFLGAEEPAVAAGQDRREVFAKWLTSKDNTLFARSLTNRIWSWFFHRGIVDPVDDVRITNPAINPELLDALTADFVAHGFDARHLMRRIVLSRTYQRSSDIDPTQPRDDANFSRAVPRRLTAESLVDALAQATGVPESFPGAPGGFTAQQLPDGNTTHEILALFGKPARQEACECERDDGSNMLQALHFINSPQMQARVANGNGRVAQLLKAHASNEALIDALYAWTVVRPPTAEERELALKHFAAYEERRAEAAQDLTWVLLNSRDFLLVR